MTETYEFKRLKAIFEGDGSDIREQFIFAGLLLTIFERFKKYVVEQVDGFFSNHFNIIDGKLQYTRGERFNNLIKEKGGHLPGQHANKEFRATLHWFYDFDGGLSRCPREAHMWYRGLQRPSIATGARGRPWRGHEL